MEQASYEVPLVTCPNNCEAEKFSLSDMDKHLAECTLELVTCEFADAGCSVKLARRDLKHHMEEKQQEHIISATLMNLKLTKESIAEKDKQLAEKDRQIAELQTQLSVFQRSFMETTKVALDRFLGIGPNDFLLDGVAMLDKGREWESRPFFSHIGGYKLILNAHNMDTKNQRTSKQPFMKVHLHTLCVDNGYPATFSVTLQVLNQLRNDDHYTRQFELVIKHFRGVYYSDPYDYISFDELYVPDRNIQYVVNDSIKLRMWVRVMSGSEYRHDTEVKTGY